jgi:predicted ester cyclase
MSTNDLKALYRHYTEECNKGKAAAMAVIDEMIDTNVVYHTAGGRDIHGLKELKLHVSETYDAFPDSHTTIEDMIVEGDKLAARFTTTSTHKAAFMGIPPTNKKIILSGIEIDRIVGGKCMESWQRYDTLGAMQQLGVIPPPKK